ncbi:hypothetical protein Ahy_B05g076824 isoform G [Arachis hypogaea]|uniref:Uncharacterized protein n=1 Tax=Arachis hypogaea TaxID=3818 RepID=A0A444Z3Z1_ARAHY|nr:hypothetical protein Ahy_B05g076824 isoform G [Arachis hypogaea]
MDYMKITNHSSLLSAKDPPYEILDFEALLMAQEDIIDQFKKSNNAMAQVHLSQAVFGFSVSRICSSTSYFSPWLLLLLLPPLPLPPLRRTISLSHPLHRTRSLRRRSRRIYSYGRRALSVATLIASAPSSASSI